MKAVAATGGKFSTKFAAAGRWQTCVQETVCQIFQKGEMRHLPCGSSGLGGRILRGLEKVVSGPHGCGVGSQHRVNGRCLQQAPGNGGCVILSCAGRGHVRSRTHIQEGSLVKNEGDELEVRVGQRPPWIFFQE